MYIRISSLSLEIVLRPKATIGEDLLTYLGFFQSGH
jgi:hypothetical protein